MRFLKRTVEKPLWPIWANYVLVFYLYEGSYQVNYYDEWRKLEKDLNSYNKTYGQFFFNYNNPTITVLDCYHFIPGV